jgi:KipI family sensor histidine kinase inhibitor
MCRVRRVGDRALLLEVDDVHGVARAVVRAAFAGVREVVPGASTVLVSYEAGTDVRALSAALIDVAPLAPASSAISTTVIETVYDGADLHDVAELTGMSAGAVVALHTACDFEVAFCGFAPGFAYLRGLDPALVVPRLSTPRTRVPAGAVAIADQWSAVYPRESPGGWLLLGRTTANVWDLDRTTPALLTPGSRVRFTVAAS